MWHEGVIGIPSEDGNYSKIHYWVKSYDEPSKTFGIDGGRISKLSLKQNDEFVANYDRGWDKRPATPEAEAAYAILLKEYN